MTEEGKKVVQKKKTTTPVAKTEKPVIQSEDKKTVIKKFQTHHKDTGSSQVQVAILTHRINSLSEHLHDHKKDKHSRRGLIGLVGKRRKLLRNLQINNPEKYSEVIQTLGLRK